MIDITKYRSQHVTVFGLGKSGISALRALKAGGAIVSGWDDNPKNREALIAETRPEYLVLSLHKNLSDPATYKWNTIQALVLSPGIPLTHPEPHPIVKMAEAAGCPIMCDIELLYITCLRANYIGVTGTNGKSTTTTLISHILKQAKFRTEVGGNLGTPALELAPLARDGTYVLEVSSFQLDLLNATHFNISVLLNITPDHLDRHGDMEGYIAAKKRIFRNQGADDVAVISVDNVHTCAIYEELLAQGIIGRIIPISTERQVKGGVSVIDGVLYNDIQHAEGKETEIIELGTLKYLAGKHNGENIAASFAACFMRGVKTNPIIKAVQNFPGLTHRLQYIGEINGISFVNDSKATNAEATEKALLSFDKPVYWLAGGLPKEGGITALEHCFPRITHAFLMGKAEEEFAATLEGKVPFSRCNNLKHAFDAAYSMASEKEKNGAVILLSPACASFDQWDSFEQRGNAFCKLVEKLESVK